MYQSGIAEALPAGLRMPVLHTVKDADADHIALWFEFVEQEHGRWQLPDYRRAAYLLGGSPPDAGTAPRSTRDCLPSAGSGCPASRCGSTSAAA
jgi:hypothetical protein